MHKTKLIALIAGLAVASYGGLATYALVSLDIESLLVCADNGGLKIPYSKQLCRRYLFTFRGTEQDIEALAQGVGASFVAQGISTVQEREQVLRFLIEKGLRIDQPDMHQTTPLHAAVLANSEEEVALLLNGGARRDIKDGRFGLTPLELAIKLQSERPAGLDRTPIISLLKDTRQ